MNKSSIALIIALIIPLAISGNALGQETAYVTSDLAISLRKSADANAPTIRGLKSGTKFTIIERDNGSGQANIRLDDGTEGWIQTRHIAKAANPQQQQLAEAQATIEKLRSRLKEAEGPSTQPQSAPDTAQAEKIATLEEENGALRTRISQLEQAQTPQQQKEPGLTLEDEHTRRWFLTGSGVMLAGLLVGLLIPRLRWRKRSSWSEL